MLILFCLAFIALCCRVSIQIVLTGAVLAVLLFWFSCRHLDYRISREIRILKKVPLIMTYICLLLYEIIIANFTVMRMILSPRFHPSPLLVTFSAPLRSDYARAMLANTITLTPGTITVQLENNNYTVHCLDESLASGIENSKFVRMLQKLEV